MRSLADDAQRCCLHPKQFISWLCPSSLSKPIPPETMTRCTDTASDITLDQFTVLKLLDKGQRGKVYLVRDNAEDCLRALKVVPRVWTSACSAVQREQAVLKYVLDLQLPFNSQMKASWYDDSYFYVLTDYCPGGELSLELARNRKFDEDRARFYAGQLVLALQSLHEARIIYRALCLQNILVNAEGNITLASFASAHSFVDDFDSVKPSTNERVGAPHYMSPQVHDGVAYSYEVDFWSLGVVLYQMLTGRLPFGSDLRARDAALPQRIKQEPVSFSKTDKISDSAGRFICQLLEKDPSKRLCSIAQVKHHPFFASINWADIETLSTPTPWVPAVPKDPAHPLRVIPEDKYKIIDTTPVPSFIYSPALSPPAPHAPSSLLPIDCIPLPASQDQGQAPSSTQTQTQTPEQSQICPSLPISSKDRPSQILPRSPPIKSVAFALPRREGAMTPDSEYLEYTQTQYRPWHSGVDEPYQTVPVQFLCRFLSLVLPRPWKLWFQHTDKDLEVTCSTTICSSPPAKLRTRSRPEPILPQHIHTMEDYVVVEPGTHDPHPGLDVIRSLSYIDELHRSRTLRNQNSSETLVGSVDSVITVADDSTYGSTVNLVKRSQPAVQDRTSTDPGTCSTSKVSRVVSWLQGLVGWSSRPSTLQG
jgi:serine/threonine protein kinase